MASDQKLHTLAEHQLIAHAFAIAITCIHQGLQQIVARLLLAALLNVSHQDAVGTHSHLFVLAKLARSSEPWIQVRLKCLPNDKLLDCADGMADEIYVFVPQLSAKQRSRDHRK